MKIIFESNILFCSVNDADVQTATKRRAHCTAEIKIVILCFDHS